MSQDFDPVAEARRITAEISEYGRTPEEGDYSILVDYIEALVAALEKCVPYVDDASVYFARPEGEILLHTIRHLLESK